jgi:hypothetical protein
MTRRKAFLGLLLAPGLLVPVVCLLTRASDDYEDRFDRIALEMDEESVCEVMGGPAVSAADDPDLHSTTLASIAIRDANGTLSASDRASVWLARSTAVVVHFSSDGTVVKKRLYTIVRPGVFEVFEDIVTGSGHGTTFLEVDQNN